MVEESQLEVIHPLFTPAGEDPCQEFTLTSAESSQSSQIKERRRAALEVNRPNEALFCRARATGLDETFTAAEQGPRTNTPSHY